MAMAENLDDGEFYLPPQFLDDDVFPSDFPLDFPSDFPLDFVSSDFSSPVESSEAESSEEDERFTDFTHRLPFSSLQLHSPQKPKEVFKSGSPQSTLCGFHKGSSEGSPNSTDKVSSPTSTLNLLHAAAGEVEKMKLNDETLRFNPNNQNHNNSNNIFNNNNNNQPLGGYPLNNPPNDFKMAPHHHHITHQQLQLLRLQMLREQQMLKLQNYASFALYQQRRSNIVAPRNACAVNLPSPAWPQSQSQQYGSGMRAVFLENPSLKKRECAGTGVFLPRRVDNPTESKRKHACSTVLVPDRVAQALNLKLDNMNGPPQRHEPTRFNVAPNMNSEVAFPKLQRNQGVANQKRSLRPQPPVKHDLGLPEWTY